jgi:hypothetical protein
MFSASTRPALVSDKVSDTITIPAADKRISLLSVTSLHFAKKFRLSAEG